MDRDIVVPSKMERTRDGGLIFEDGETFIYLRDETGDYAKANGRRVKRVVRWKDEPVA